MLPWWSMSIFQRDDQTLGTGEMLDSNCLIKFSTPYRQEQFAHLPPDNATDSAKSY